MSMVIGILGWMVLAIIILYLLFGGKIEITIGLSKGIFQGYQPKGEAELTPPPTCGTKVMPLAPPPLERRSY